MKHLIHPNAATILRRGLLRRATHPLCPADAKPQPLRGDRRRPSSPNRHLHPLGLPSYTPRMVSNLGLYFSIQKLRHMQEETKTPHASLGIIELSH
ncbi:hypothetical protein L1049_007481 [Liquidambar formosana]|uniref:Uncharacterized protein n=1 Tax=Liquidambar formosana TaxID=63359 RepID=A0AAP0S1H8_LIQFO